MSQEDLLFSFCKIENPFSFLSDQKLIKFNELNYNIDSEDKIINVNSKICLKLINKYISKDKEIYSVIINWLKRNIYDSLKIRDYYIVAVDFNDLKVKEVTKYFDFMKELINMNVPSENMKYCIIYNVSSSIRFILNLIHPIMSYDIKKKIVLMKKDSIFYNSCCKFENNLEYFFSEENEKEE